MRTTIRLPDDLLKELKKRAAERGVTFTRLVEEALRESLARTRDAERDAAPVSLVTTGGTGTRPGVDLDDRASLIDLMDGRGA